MAIVPSITILGIIATPVYHAKKGGDKVDGKNIVGVKEEADSSHQHSSNIYISLISLCGRLVL